MKIVFFGSSNFAVPALEALLAAGQEISCVVTQPDRSKGRGLHPEGTAIKNAAGAHRVKIYQPERINAPEAVKCLKKFGPDLFVVLSYGQILSRQILEIPKIFALNAHASLLPKYRGAAPINWAVICGEKATGVTVMKMEEKMDAGAVMLQEEISIEDSDSSVTLEPRLSGLAAKLMLEALGAIAAKNYKLIAQDEKKASFAPKLKKEDGLIDWNNPAQDIYNLVRGVLPWPGAFTYYKGKLLKIYRAGVDQSTEYRVQSTEGEVIRADKNGIIVSTGKGQLLVEELQVEGARRMTAQDFLAGHKISAGEVLGKN